MDELTDEQVTADVLSALTEDVRDGDLTAELIPELKSAKAQVICRENAVFCGQRWFEEVFQQLSDQVTVEFFVKDGDFVPENTLICTLKGPARSLLTGERSALNFIQTLSGTATRSYQYAQAVKTETKVLDTRKTIPGLRVAQKYAVKCGGCFNHRMGLYDAVLIKENHIEAAGSIAQAVRRSRSLFPDAKVEVEVENLAELDQAMNAKADIALLDNFSHQQIKQAVELNQGVLKLEVSGNVTIERLPELAVLGVDFISTGALTKDLKSIDFSMRFSQ